MKALSPFAALAVAFLAAPAIAAVDLIWSLDEDAAAGFAVLSAGVPESEWGLSLSCNGNMISVSQPTILDLPTIGVGQRRAFVIEAYGTLDANVSLDDPIWELFLAGEPLMVDGAEFALSSEKERILARRFFEVCRASV